MKKVIPILSLFFFALGAKTTQAGNYTVEEYIEAHKRWAVEEMLAYNVPASITMAQAIIESSFGNSYLAQEANNHFGIKCHSDWTGESVAYDDDTVGECFRKYNRTSDSFHDHSLFLFKNPRYAGLFHLSITDYVGWAYGLQEAGYATDPNYPLQLVETIEKYKLYELDSRYLAVKDPAGPVASSHQNEKKKGIFGIFHKRDKPADRAEFAATNDAEISPRQREKEKKYKYDYQLFEALEEEEEMSGKKARLKAGEIVYYNRIKTTVVPRESSPAEVARAYEMNVKKICAYNDIKPTEKFPANTRVYLQPKRIIGVFDHKITKVEEGQSMWDISQKYGIKLNKLYRKNHLKKGEEPAEGQVVYLRSKNPRRPVIKPEEEDYIAASERAAKTRKNESESLEINSQEKPLVSVNKNKKPETTDVKTGLNVNTESIKRVADKDKTATTKKIEYVYAKDEAYDWLPANENNYGSPKKSGSIDWITTDSKPENLSSASAEMILTNPIPKGKVVEKGKLDNPLLEVRNYVPVNKSPELNNKSIATHYNAAEMQPEWLTTKPAPVSPKVNAGTQKASFYIVQPKETLYSISKRFNTTVEAIKEANALTSNDIKIGQNLIIVMP